MALRGGTAVALHVGGTGASSGVGEGGSRSEGGGSAGEKPGAFEHRDDLPKHPPLENSHDDGFTTNAVEQVWRD